MKSQLVAVFGLGLLTLLACTNEPAPQQYQPPIPLPPTLIGQGVEIYRARLEWMPFNRTVLLKSATILGDKPVIGYDDIKAYTRYRAGERSSYQLTFELTKRVVSLPGQEASPTFGMPTGGYWLAPDTGLCVAVDRQLIYAGIYGHISTVHGKDLIFQSADDYSMPNTLIVKRDSGYTVNAQVYWQTDPDPRYDKRLLDRLRQDGKLGF